MESAHSAVWNPPSAVWHQGASLVYHQLFGLYIIDTQVLYITNLTEVVYHQPIGLYIIKAKPCISSAL
ncbi:MAG: hypothetical protein IJE25_03995 [Clostridia bacterium]|nr:hypothetical protein [Clostridia bacterium]